ncbi:hypothetical protein G6F57_007569 [Rhizopus arrhizus]|uniref:C2H2-type domain-containing protein n=1 Tax=Rhizopus oryzae TaxID=64495 RepID=A0A9P7BTP3_RHIOR|nr:hypothetical protein G6F23_002578 [Rhizopus arrhizus]KAG1246652.1 hypothetical protein G6F68_014548 [Rhizopus microsporus]KAG1420827.1 hypothetical protein G6F58_004019 [Rhizopus delemar]KAG0764755.1 hypothetical protein G6F24_004966 [Rhizopus arrhizus]KAG0783749.1 hypothetical protein G6F22_008563 [Rhizopus arrhizus]
MLSLNTGMNYMTQQNDPSYFTPSDLGLLNTLMLSQEITWLMNPVYTNTKPLYPTLYPSSNPAYPPLPVAHCPSDLVSPPPTVVASDRSISRLSPFYSHPYPRPPSREPSTTHKRYVCQLCSKRFTRPSSLTTHIYSHTGEKPFKCPVGDCGRQFSVVSNLRRHAKIHSHPTS